jgi:UDP-N-acetylmuramoyl-tripeptide--D-alanyl-D-alanine ligase
LAEHLVEGAAGRVPARHFPDAEAAEAALGELVRAGDAVLVKGSRGVRLERLVDALLERFGEERR